MTRITTTPDPELNDSLDDLFGAPMGEVRVDPIRAPANYQPKGFDEVCPKCRGTGRYRQFGSCFACKGKGKHTFKTSKETRVAAQQSRADRQVRQHTDLWDDFCTAQPEVSGWIKANPDFSFAVSLKQSVEKFGSLTDRQLAAVWRMIDKDQAQQAEKAIRLAKAPVVNTDSIDRLKSAFDAAIAKAKEKGRGFRPRITIGKMVISPTTASSANPGALYVKMAGIYLGKIMDGCFQASRDCTDEQQTRVLAFVADPKAAAEAYGIETGNCCICNRTLTDKGSIKRGIGPICAGNFGW